VHLLEPLVKINTRFDVPEPHSHLKKKLKSNNNYKYILIRDPVKKIRDPDSSLHDLAALIPSLRPASRVALLGLTNLTRCSESCRRFAARRVFLRVCREDAIQRLFHLTY
jgi:hypothetical protein